MSTFKQIFSDRIIKTLSLVMIFGHLFHLCYVMAGVHLVMLYNETNCIKYKVVLHNSKQPKSKFTHFVKKIQTQIEQLNLK
jgi:hypothetical protein